MKTIEISGRTCRVTDIAGPLGKAFPTLPYALRVLAENALRCGGDGDETAADRIAARAGDAVAFRPSRLILQDMLGLPLLVDMMAMRSAIAEAGGDPARIDMTLPVDMMAMRSAIAEAGGDPARIDMTLPVVLIARNAVVRGLAAKPQVKTSLAPGSRVVATYLEAAGLMAPLNALGFHVAAYSCSTCNGMSGPLAPEIEAAIRENEIKGVAVLSGNRNFAGRIHPLASRNMIASPPLVVAYALSGTILTDVTADPLGEDTDGNPVTLADLWPAEQEVEALMAAHGGPEDYRANYDGISTVNPHWNRLEVTADTYDWPPSTYVTFPPFIESIAAEQAPIPAMKGLRPLAILGDSITTDHISPSGAIAPESDAGKFLIGRGVEPRDFNSYGTRRGSSDIVIRSTFANGRLRNEMMPGREGPWTRIEPEGREATLFEAIEAYRARGQGLVVIGGREYGCGSSRDTAAKAPWLAGVRAVVVESFERIHRSNLVNMGIAPLCFPDGVDRLTLALDGSEVFDVTLTDDLTSAILTVHRKDGAVDTTPLDLRLYNDAERETFRQGGLLSRAYRRFLVAG